MDEAAAVKRRQRQRRRDSALGQTPRPQMLHRDVSPLPPAPTPSHVLSPRSESADTQPRSIANDDHSHPTRRSRFPWLQHGSSPRQQESLQPLLLVWKWIYTWLLPMGRAAMKVTWVAIVACAVCTIILARVDRVYCASPDGGIWERLETLLGTPEPVRRSLADHVDAIAGLPLQYAEALLPLIEPVSHTWLPDFMSSDALRDYSMNAEQLFRLVEEFSELSPAPGSDPAAAIQGSKTLCNEYMSATELLYDTMDGIELHLNTIWVEEYRIVLYFIMVILEKVDRQQAAEEEERYWAERAGEFDEETHDDGSDNASPAGRKAAWERAKKHNEGIYTALGWHVAKWHPYHDKIAARITELHRQLDNVRTIEEHLISLRLEHFLELESRQLKATGERVGEECGWEERWEEERKLKVLNEAKELLHEIRLVDIPRRRIIHSQVDAAAWELAWIGRDITKINLRLSQLRDGGWREPAISFSSPAPSFASAIADAFSPRWAASWPNYIHSLPGGDAILGLLFGTIEYTLPANAPVFRRLVHERQTAEERVSLTRKRRREFFRGQPPLEE
ncbi:hypothetical protein MFIFM68171_07650 [Madurella fahalii]|uniref:Uncharacterized protein n=1 Tax=Madurella fahalii TaxID=1157608 RepID=A0ABQ0GIB7_9PEZI